MQDRLFIRMLTGDDLLVEAPVQIQWKGRAARALFAVLALHPGEPVSRDRLAGLLWPESDQQAARGSLRMALLALRRVLDPVDPDLIRATNESIMLDVKREAVDWALFERLCARPDAQSRLEALELYKGDLETAFPKPHEAVTELLRDQRERLREIAIKTGIDLITTFEDAGEQDRIRSIIRNVLTIEPANEPAHRAMMRAHAAAGDRSAVLRQYEQCRKALKEDFGLDPSAETMALRDEAVGAEAEEPPESAAQAGNSASDEAASFEQPPSRRTRPGWRGLLLTAVALVTIILVARAFWPCGLMSKCPDDAPLAVIVLSPLEFDETDPRVAAVAGEITKIFANTLSRMPGARVFTPASPGKLPALLNDSYLVAATVERSGDQLRFYVDLLDHGSGELVFPDRFDVGIDTLAPIADKLEARLIPELQSRIGLDRPSK